MNALDLSYINRLAPYKVWTENGRDYYTPMPTAMLTSFRPLKCRIAEAKAEAEEAKAEAEEAK